MHAWKVLKLIGNTIGLALLFVTLFFLLVMLRNILNL